MTELDIITHEYPSPPPVTVIDTRRIVQCLREDPRFHTLLIYRYPLIDAAVLNVLRNGLPMCTSLTTVKLNWVNLGNEALDRLRPAFYNTAVTTLSISGNNIRGQRGGEVIRDSMIGNKTLGKLNLSRNHIGPDGSIRLGTGLAVNDCLQNLHLNECHIGNNGLANLLLSMGGEMINNSLTDLCLNHNNIQGADGGRQVSLLLQRCPALKVLELAGNHLGPLGARELAPGLAAAATSQLKVITLRDCELGKEGVANLVADGQVNTSLTSLDLRENDIQGTIGGENVLALSSRCTNLDSINADENILSPDQQRRLELLLDRKRLCTEASALAGSTFSVLFRAVEEAHRHEHGLGAIFVILQNDGDDYFCNANNRAIGCDYYSNGHA